jgi:hypothetical protein
MYPRARMVPGSQQQTARRCHSLCGRSVALLLQPIRLDLEDAERAPRIFGLCFGLEATRSLHCKLRGGRVGCSAAFHELPLSISGQPFRQQQVAPCPVELTFLDGAHARLPPKGVMDRVSVGNCRRSQRCDKVWSVTTHPRGTSTHRTASHRRPRLGDRNPFEDHLHLALERLVFGLYGRGSLRCCLRCRFQPFDSILVRSHLRVVLPWRG